MWIHLDPSLLRTHLAEPEILALETAATTADVSNILAEETHIVAEAWRGRLRKGMIIDARTDYVPSELLVFILVHVRQRSYTRLPNMETLLDQIRRDEIRRADRIFDDPFLISIEPPEEPEPEPDPWVVVNPVNYQLDKFPF